jgi:16S rRNA (guanine527-N7)-methyltransferase
VKTLPNLETIWEQSLAWNPNNQQRKKFQELYEYILLKNQQLNLTRITGSEDFWEKHLWDSLVGIMLLGLTEQKELKIIDIGTGGGFPGIPVAIAFPFWQVTLLDSTQKKVNFLQDLVTQLQLNNVQALTGRAEVIGQSKLYRETYDLATIRAVGGASVCAEYCLPLLKTSGLAILYRGHWTQRDTQNLNLAATQLGGKIEEIKEFATPLTNSTRNCIYLRKVNSTPNQYPRPVGIPNQHPL